VEVELGADVLGVPILDPVVVILEELVAIPVWCSEVLLPVPLIEKTGERL
jgi:hypothetical protein